MALRDSISILKEELGVAMGINKKMQLEINSIKKQLVKNWILDDTIESAKNLSYASVVRASVGDSNFIDGKNNQGKNNQEYRRKQSAWNERLTQFAPTNKRVKITYIPVGMPSQLIFENLAYTARIPPSEDNGGDKSDAVNTHVQSSRLVARYSSDFSNKETMIVNTNLNIGAKTIYYD